MELQAFEYFGPVSHVEAVSSSRALKQYLVEEFPELFNRVGCTRRPHSLALKHVPGPVAQPPQRILQALWDALEAAGIISKMNEASVLCERPRHSTEENEWLRACMDPRHVK